MAIYILFFDTAFFPEYDFCFILQKLWSSNDVLPTPKDEQKKV